MLLLQYIPTKDIPAIYEIEKGSKTAIINKLTPNNMKLMKSEFMEFNKVITLQWDCAVQSIHLNLRNFVNVFNA